MNSRRSLPNRRAHEVFEYEHDGITYVAGVGRFGDGQVAEIFLNAGRHGCAAETAARDGAIILSIALQFGADVGTIRHALTRLEDGSAARPIGKLLDLLEGQDR